MTEAASAKGSHRAPVAILGVPFDNVTTSDTLRLIEQMIASRQSHYLVTANVDFVVQALSDVELRRILFDAHLVVADGMPLVWASRWLGNPLPERVTGSGMTPLLLAEAAAKGWRVFFLGGSEQSVARAAANTRAKHPQLQLVGAYSPPFKPLVEMDHEDILRRLREARPDILLVAFGCPKQEKWLSMHYRAAGVPVGIGVGATIDFLAGTMKRAPVWMQKVGLEWLFRLLQEPRRLFRRYVTGLWIFGWAILRQLMQMRAARKTSEAASPWVLRSTSDAAVVQVKLPPRLDAATVERNYASWQQLPTRTLDLLVDAAGTEFIDSTGVGALIRLRKAVRERGRHLALVAPSKALVQSLKLMKLSDFFDQAPDVPAALKLTAHRREECNVVLDLSPTSGFQPIVWQGEITAVNSRAIGELTESRLLHASDKVTIDVSAVRFIDSSGIGLMVRLRKLAHRQNVELEYIGPSETIRGIGRMLRMEEYLFGSKP